MMNWNKEGVIFKNNDIHHWSISHAQVPVVDIINEKVWRVYYGSRDAAVHSRISYFDVEAGNPKNVLYIHNKPVLDVGKLGTFDELGVCPSYILNHQDKKYLFYIGYNVTKTLPYHNGIGVALWNEQTNMFERISAGPLFERTLKEPYFNASSCVHWDEKNKIFRIYYLSTTDWIEINNKPEPLYHIKYAESDDLINWRREGKVAIDYVDGKHEAIARPLVLFYKGSFRMWYSYRNVTDYKSNKDNSYRIGYAESVDAIHWKRKDEEVGIDVSETGWDSEMVCYPYVIQWKEKLYMFYNGNGFGKTGIGYAVL